MSSPLRHVLLSSMKDEGPFILEFVAHHRVLGFDAIHIASNDCSDGTDLLLDVLDANGIVTHTRNPLKPGDVPQHRGYARIRRKHHFDADADWIMVLDADEFLYVAQGAGRVGDLTALAAPEVDVIALNAMNFGTSEGMEWRPGRVTRQFTRRLPENARQNGPVKCLSRGRGRWRGLHNHYPIGFQGAGDAVRYMRANGAEESFPVAGRTWDYLRNVPADRITHELAWYNHYPIKSIDAYMMRRKRGRGASAIDSPSQFERHSEAYWMGFARADIEDRRILDRYGAETEAEMARLLALPGVAAAQAETERRYGALIAEIANDPDI
ncbi:glycosyltransferase family 2 protein [Paracoccus sp. S1E-3]|uniref:glycosyltransferase family 2 protein n=1 Tax=Paracoccus sp. S1E-3 TaxID=2756130 RepID=UPI0015EF05BF|nr:glycosyltransferase family 2 protein [Paracoccus sp. S1E-3]MBA4489467.1 glycosyltransferase family 2 protein [Paracoccus sp. S1E-3]